MIAAVEIRPAVYHYCLFGPDGTRYDVYYTLRYPAPYFEPAEDEANQRLADAVEAGSIDVSAFTAMLPLCVLLRYDKTLRSRASSVAEFPVCPICRTSSVQLGTTFCDNDCGTCICDGCGVQEFYPTMYESFALGHDPACGNWSSSSGDSA